MPSDTPSFPGDRDHAGRLSVGLRYEQAGLWGRALATYQAILVGEVDRITAVDATIRMARVHRAQARWPEALAAAAEAAALALAIPDDDLWAEAVCVDVGVRLMQGDLERADQLAREGLARARAPRVRGLLVHNRGTVAAQRRQFDDAAVHFGDAVAWFRQAGYELGSAFSLNSTSAAAHDAGRPDEALALAREANRLARRLGALDQVVLAVENEADALVSLGRLDEAEALASEALGHFRSIGDAYREVECLEIMGRVFGAQPGSGEQARHCFGRALRTAREIGAATLVARLEGRAAAAA
jgi:tetratricopeptide (TPR) repeat protein